MASISRINSTNTGGFDQITAVSQEMINDQLKTTMNSIPELKSFEPEDAIWGKFSTVFKNAMLDPCHCKIPASGNNFSSVLFYINFKSGQWVVTDSTDKKNVKTTTYDLKGWVFCCVVNMGLSDLGPGKEAQLKERLCIPGDYSIQRLYLDFTTADVANFRDDESKFGTLKFSDFPAAMRNTFELGVLDWMSYLNDSAIDLMYHGTATNSAVVNPIQPTFPPEQVIFQTYPFKEASGLTSANSTKNSLLYLETCVGNPPADTVVHWSGNFITNGDDGKPNVNGSMVISRKLFFNQFLLPLLREINQRVQITPSSAKNTIDGLSLSFKWNYYVGWDPSHPSSSDQYYDFTEDLQNTQFKWEKTKPDAKDNAGSTGFLNSTLTVKSDTKAYLKWEAGGHVAFYTVTTHYRVETTDEQIGIDNDSYIDVNVQFQIKFTLQSVSKGVLEIKTTFPKWDGTKDDNDNLSDAIHTTGSTHASSIWQKNPADEQGTIKNQLTARLQNNSWLVDRLKSVLSEHRFVFPGNGTFSFSDPCFNKNGDLMVALAYDGLADPTTPVGLGVVGTIPKLIAPALVSNGAEAGR